MKKITTALLLAVLFTACIKPEKKVPLINNVMLLQQGGDEKGYIVAQQVNETLLSRLIEEDAVDVYANPITVFVKTLSATQDTNFYSIRMKNDPEKPATVVSLTRARFNDLVSKECEECIRTQLKQDAATKAWTVIPASSKKI
jgi:hypothetical protein